MTLHDEEDGTDSGYLAVDVGAGDASADRIDFSETMDVVTDAAGRRLLYGETAIDGAGLAFGTIPGSWKDGMKAVKVEAVHMPSNVAR